MDKVRSRKMIQTSQQLNIMEKIMYVMLPLEHKKVDIKKIVHKFANYVNQASQQVSGTVTIDLPEKVLQINDQTCFNDLQLMSNYQSAMESWTQTIKETIKRQNSKLPESKTALAQIELWRSRSANYATLHQQLSSNTITIIRRRLEKWAFESSTTANTVNDFNKEFKQLTKNFGQAKDNVKFLTTLQRQFKNLASDQGFTSIQQTLPSLMKGLKMVWIISRHYKTGDKMNQLMSLITNEIIDKVQSHININKLFDLGQNAQQQLLYAKNLIMQGKSILQTWKKQFQSAKESMTTDQLQRWEFNPIPMTDRLVFTRDILNSLITITQNINKFLVFLGPNLKAVTGNSQGIDKLIRQVKTMVIPFQLSKQNFFSKVNVQQWNLLFNSFKNTQQGIQKTTIKLIDDTFKDLRSSEGAFQLLNNFKGISDLDQIAQKLQKKYTDVLNTYKRQLQSNKELFEEGKDQYEHGNKSLIVSRGKPPIAGIISWAHSIMYRIKTPILKFIKSEHLLDKNQFSQVKQQYLNIVRTIDKWQEDKFKQWYSHIMEKAMMFLKTPILEKEGQNNYRVNFSQEFKVLIKETKQLEKMNHQISKSIINIALQQKEYYRYIDNLKIMLRQYHDAVNTLTPIQHKLLQKQIHNLNVEFAKGQNSKTLSSLGINDFIMSCRRKINEFRDIKKKVNKSSGMIEDIIKNIEDAVILKEFNFESRKQNPFSATQFANYFDEHMQRTVQQVAQKYKMIGDQFLKSIEQNIFGTNSRCCQTMKQYYYYWERRVYNSIFKMCLRAILSFKTLVSETAHPNSNSYPLFQIIAEYQHPTFNTKPQFSELLDILYSISANIIASTKQFWRWMDGSCRFCQTSKGPNQQPIQYHTFFPDIHQNPIIIKAKYLYNFWVKKGNDRARQYTKHFQHDQHKGLWDNKSKIVVDKWKDKNPPPSLQLIQKMMSQYKAYMQEYASMPKQKTAIFFSVQFQNVIDAFKNEARDWLLRYGNVLKELGSRELQTIRTEIQDFRLKLIENPQKLDDLKQMLNNISILKNESMMMQFRIADIYEKFRTLQMYKHPIEPEKLAEAYSLEENWKSLLKQAKSKDNKLVEIKKEFANITKIEVQEFKKGLVTLYEHYKNNGPGSQSTNLDDGLEYLDYYKSKLMELNKKKQDLVLAQKLFNLDISSFPQLVNIEEESKILQPLYDVYAEIKSSLKDFSQMLWVKLDAQLLKQAGDKLQRQRKKLTAKYAKNGIFHKLEIKIKAFRDSIPLIQQLKNGSITDRHWQKLMKQTGNSFQSSIKTMTLEDVFKLNLQNYAQKVAQICNQANQQHKNQEQLLKIELFWKKENFELKPSKKGNDIRGYVLDSTEEIKQELDDQLANLQTIASSRYAGAFVIKIRKWEQALNRITQCIDVWLLVQKKWLYLQGIFIGNQDIRQQLRQESKKFDKNNIAYKKIMETTNKIPNVYSCCVHNQGRLMELKTLSEELDKRQKSLSDYLNSKRNVFPRFYFLSDQDLLSILGSNDSKAVQPHMLKLFDNCRELLMARSTQVSGMESDEGQRFDFKEQQKTEGPVQIWMTKVDQEMQRTLHRITKENVFYYANKERLQWVLENLGMVAIAGTQIWWTWRVQDVFSKVKIGNKYAMKQQSAKQTKDLNDLIDLIRTQLNNRQRKKINTLIIVDVHARDIVDRFVRDSILDAREFEWESQLRFYWVKDQNDIRIRQCTGTFTYGYEYEGLNGRLVITPLTDRCVMTLTTALTFNLGGSPAGPAGTGKTETVKDLAKSLAIRCCVTNCGQGLDYKAMGIIFSGLVQTGFWGCFDQFNRITAEVLSVVSVQVRTIQNALTLKLDKIELLKNQLNVKHTVGIFVTMNPGYAGRTQLPDNLKSLFRPVTMVVPDSHIICQIMLMSEGFNQARQLAKKMTVLYKLASEQLSKQYHYDFGLRALKSVLVMAGTLKRQARDIAEQLTLMRALRDMNIPKFVFEDVPLFKGLITDLFPSMDVVRKPYQKKAMIQEIYRNAGLKPLDDQIDKVVQLFQTMLTRHTTMVVGPTVSGKSTVIEILKRVQGTTIYCMNPKAITVSQLYGEMNLQTRQWKDGLLSKTFRTANEKPFGSKEAEPRWILFDGDVDAVWVQNMNSVMDDNKLLTLINGDRIRLERYCKLLFQVGDLQYASPATISRCGMVYVDPKNLGYQPYWQKWMYKWYRQKQKYENIIEILNELFPKYIPFLINRMYDGVDGEDIVKPFNFSLPRSNLSLIVQLTRLLDAMINPDNQKLDPDSLQFIFIFAVIWSLGSCLSQQSKKPFEQFLRKTSGRHLPPSLFDYYYDYNKNTKNWTPWEKLVNEYNPPEDGRFSSILVPTVDTVRFSSLLGQNIKQKYPIMFVGESGTAKTVIISNYLNSLPIQNYMRLNINFSSRTTSMDLQLTIEDNIDKRSGRIFGPKNPGKKLIVLIDDAHMPRLDIYGTQQPIALLKFLIEYGYLYERGGNLQKKIIKDMQFVSAILPPSVATNLDPRFLSLFSCLNLLFPSQQNLTRIYNSILKYHLSKFQQEIAQLSQKITQITLKLYRLIVQQLPRTPVKFHYIFNLRDLSRIYQGLCRSTPDKFDNRDQIIRLWRNQCMRVFCDRLITEEDRKLVGEKTITELITYAFPDSLQMAMVDPILFGDYMQSQPADIEIIDPKLYEDCGGFDQVKNKFQKLIADYNDYNPEMNLVLFRDALEHLTKILRIVRLPRGHALLVGYGGSGKQSLTKLATYTSSYTLFTITLTRGYKEKEFREDLKKLCELLTVGQCLFLFTDAHVLEEGFLQLLNNLLTIGMVPALFDQQGKKTMSDKVRNEAKKKGIQQTKQDIWIYFLDKVKQNLHIVLAMSPAGDTLRVRCRNFPGLISNTSIDWFQPWPEEALMSVAENYLKDQDLPEQFRQKIVMHIVMIHISVQQYSKRFEAELKRRNFSTPKNYLDFLNNYIKLLTKNRKSFTEKSKRYADGLLKLQEAQEQVTIMKTELAVKQQEVNAERTSVSNILSQIKQKSAVASIKQKEASQKKTQLDADAQIIAKQQAEADRILLQAEPEMKAAEKALQVIKIDQIRNMKSLANPPDPVKFLGQCVLLLKPTGKQNPDQGWDGAKKMMNNPSQFIDVLKNFGNKLEKISQRQIKMIKNIKENPENRVTLDDMITVNQAAYNILEWLNSTMKLYQVYKKITPLKQKVEQMKRKSQKMQKQLNQINSILKQINQKLAQLNYDKKIKQERLEELEKAAELMEKRLNAAEKLLKGLGRQRQRWTQDKNNLEIKTVQLLGDCLTCSSFLSYAGPFDYKFRKKMFYQHFRSDIKQKQLPCTQEFKIEKLLTSDLQIAQWASEELPSDELSVQNGILTTRASRWPLCIDPQIQALTWIKKKYQNDLKVKNMNEGALVYLKDLENCIKFGKPFLFESVDQQLDPTIDPILQKNFTIKSGFKILKLGDNELQFNQDFKLYLTTKLANPKYTPEIMGKTMVINYTVTLMGLRDQLLNVVVGFQKPEKEKQRKQLIHSMSENRKKLKEAEDQLLTTLNNATGSLLENDQLIQTLQQTKKVSIEISDAIEKGEVTQRQIEIARQAYSPAAKRGAILFFTMSFLSAISEMYEYSLNSYLSVFNISLQTSSKQRIAQARLRAIIEKLTINVYEYVCLGIFQTHKLMFSFQMTIMIMDQDKELNHMELDFFLKGNISLDQVSRPKPYNWIPQTGWKDMQKLVTIGQVYKNLIYDLQKNQSQWKKWYDQQKPQIEEMPIPYNKLSPFQILLLLRVFRPDRVINGIKQFIIHANRNQDRFVQPPTLNFNKIYDQSSQRSPIVFILSPGADPLSDVQRLAEQRGFSGTKFRYLSMGQGMQKQATEYVQNAYQRGHWLMLQNCHLLTDWLKNNLQKYLESMQRIHKDYRLWLTTQPTDRFPLGILQKSLKIVTQPPDGLKLNTKSILSKITEQQLNQCTHYAFKPLVYVISFFHAIIQDRRKYGKIGWNITYDFNHSDFTISFDLLGMYLNKALTASDQNVPWNSLKYLIGQAMYGGRVTDSYDRRILITYLEEYMGEFIFDKNRQFFFAKTPQFLYGLPKQLNLEGFLNLVNQIPIINSPTVFGLHPNAQITYFTNAAKALWQNILSMQASAVTTSGRTNKQEYIESIANDILAKMPQVLWDVLALRKQSGENISPTKIVLFQQLERFNNLILRIKDTLYNLKRALSGQIGMSSQLDELSISLFNGFLPNQWRKLAPQTQKKLGSWIQHFGGRVKQYNKWVDLEPAVIWLSGLHIPQSYLTALVQTTCRAKNWALDKSTLYTEVLKTKNMDDFKKKPEHGCFVKGIFLEGAQWDVGKSCLKKQYPKQLIFQMPIIQVIPVESNKLKLKDSLKTPVYVTQNRRNAMGVGLVFEADLYTQQHISHWILQGVALMLNIDF